MDRTPRTAAESDQGPLPPRSVVGEDDGTHAGVYEEDLPACQSCRKRKLKCSREMPSCSQCLRLEVKACECLYRMKQKPGLKMGAVENLNRRLDVLERILLDDTGKKKSQLAFLDLDVEDLNVLPFYPLGESPDSIRLNVQQRTPAKQDYLQVESASQSNGPQKRRRLGERSQSPNGTFWDSEEWNWIPQLPPLPLLEAIVAAHFHTVHHWIPILHETRFRAKLKHTQERNRLAVLLHALVSTVIKYVNFEDFDLSLEEVEQQIRVSRKVVILNAMDSLSVENIQALIFLSFDYMGSGQVSKAWPIIGSLTRTVEFLQLTVEPDDSQKQPLLRPLTLLEKPKDWTESEERRRLFWNVFLLDRICSVTSGWHTSLTSDDVHRRLPCGGGMWAREEPVSTPFFGIWDKSNAKIGHSIAHVPALYPSPKAVDHTCPGARSTAGDVDISKLGALAYCIEATENLSQVTSFFLQQSVDFEDREEVKNWLTRFKELDLRLVHWKMFLPQQWQDSNVSRDVSVIKMDPNLTLAHITHNASMILLHQHIAYPPARRKDVVKLPSSCSAETCQLAAVEIASIAQKYLRYMGGIVNSQFAFCAFVAARVLLVHWRVHDTPLAPELFSLLESLLDMSRRWRGYSKVDKDVNQQEAQQESRLHNALAPDLAAKYAAQLQDLHSRCLRDVNFASIGYAEVLSDASLGGLVHARTSLHEDHLASIQFYQSNNYSDQNTPSGTGGNIQRHQSFRCDPAPAETLRSSSDGTSMNRGDHPLPHSMPTVATTTKLATWPHPPIAYDPQGVLVPPEEVSPHTQVAPRAAAPLSASNIMGTSPSGLLAMNMNHLAHARSNTAEDDELTAMSHMLLGQQFLEMDRVITLDGTDFYYDAGGRAGPMS